MTLRGERFALELDSAEQEMRALPVLALSNEAEVLTVRDVLERPTLSSNTPPGQLLNGRRTGFPEHKKRRSSCKFKQECDSAQTPADNIATHSTHYNARELNNASFKEREKQEIDRENNERLARMSPDAIVHEQQELLHKLSPNLVARLLKRQNIHGSGYTGKRCPIPGNRDSHDANGMIRAIEPDTSVKPSAAAKSVAFAESTNTINMFRQQELLQQPLTAPPSPPPHHHHQPPEFTASVETDCSSPSYLEQAPERSEPDPLSPHFLLDLHRKYLPNLPPDLSKLAWMSEPSASIDSYSAGQGLTPTSSLRFSFAGTILDPEEALHIPITEGLHHHGDSPNSAGYTIPELAHLARSIVPAQRCIAYRTLGRLLYRLGSGEFGLNSDRTISIWKCIEACQVIQVLQQEDLRRARHMSASAYATEALWLWRRGGGQRLGA